MNVSVWDTYVTKKDGSTMHFDIITSDTIRDEAIVHTFGKDYLQSKNEDGQSLTANECRFCHIESATTEMEIAINDKGYFIVEMENCK
jgi:hypothetical protein